MIQHVSQDHPDTPFEKAAQQHDSSNLDLLRSLAVLFVFSFHTYLFQVQARQIPEFSPFRLEVHQLGHWGVLIFFVHTSVVLNVFSGVQQFKSSGKNLYAPFLTRRVFRIYPLSIFMVLMVVFLKLPVAHLSNGVFQATEQSWQGVLSNLFLIQNFSGS